MRTREDEGSGRPSTSRTYDHRAEDALITENIRIAASEIALTVGITVESAFAIVSGGLG